MRYIVFNIVFRRVKKAGSSFFCSREVDCCRYRTQDARDARDARDAYHQRPSSPARMPVSYSPRLPRDQARLAQLLVLSSGAFRCDVASWVTTCSLNKAHGVCFVDSFAPTCTACGVCSTVRKSLPKQHGGLVTYCLKRVQLATLHGPGSKCRRQ